MLTGAGDALLQAVFRERVEGLAALAREAADREDTGPALLGWLEAVTSYAVSARGMAEVLTSAAAADPGHVNACSAILGEAAEDLLRRAAREGLVPPEVTVTDLITLITGIALATEHHPDPAAASDRLLRLAVRGISACWI